MKKKNLIILLVVVFMSGIFFSVGSYLLLKKGKAFVQKVLQKMEERRIANIPRAKEPLVICDFEDSDDMRKWDFSGARAELSQEHATSGKHSFKITYQAMGGAAAAKIEKYFDTHKDLADWSRYEVLSFDIFNPNPGRERIILQIKDIKNNKIKIDLYLDPNANNHIEVDIRTLWESLNPSKIGQYDLFLWDNKNTKVFYLDNVILLPAAALEKKNKNIAAEEFLPKPTEKVYATGDYFAFNSQRWSKTDLTTNSSFTEIPLMLLSNYFPDNSVDLPFSGGVPFARGQLFSLDNLKVADNQENIIPSQIKVLAKWPDQSIKWVLVNFKSSVSSSEKLKYYLRYAKDIQKQNYDSKLTLKENTDGIVVNTGVLQFSVSKRNFYLFDNVWLDKNGDGKYDDNELVSSKGDLVLVHNGREYHSYLDKNYELTVEERGPLKVCIKAKGWFVSEKGDKFCQFIIRIYAFEGSSYVKVQHTFVYTGYPENKFHYLYKGKRLPKNETIDAIYIKTPVKITEAGKFTFSADSKIIQGDLSETVEFLQNKFNSYKITKKDKAISSGNKLGGWLDLSTSREGITLGVKNFWQQFPKGFRIDKENQCIVTYLWPKQGGELDFKTTEAAFGPDSVARGSAFGLAKTHEVFFYFHKGDYKDSCSKEVAVNLSTDSFVTPSAQWISDTKVLGRVWPYDKRLGSAEDFLSRLFDWGARQIENFGWYGMIDFGDTLSWYRSEDEDNSYGDWGWHPVGRWGWFNCEAVGTHTGALIQFLRTQDMKYFKFGANLARHIMDIDTCHYNTVANDKRLKRVIPDDYSRVGSMHRHNGNHWGDRNEETSHTNLNGLMIYYYVTGDDRARDVLEEVGDFFLSERITYFRHPDIAPQRSIANVLWGEVDLYELTGEQKYKNAADKWVSLFYAGQKHDGAWGEDYNPVRKRWDGKPHMGYIREYTLPALIAYHQLTGNKAVADSIIRATDYVIKGEGYAAYFDASAYSYWLTGNKKYLDNIKARLDFTVNHQRRDGDPLWDGMIYQKAYYSRVSEYLYKTPFAFEVTADEKYP